MKNINQNKIPRKVKNKNKNSIDITLNDGKFKLDMAHVLINTQSKIRNVNRHSITDISLDVKVFLIRN